MAIRILIIDDHSMLRDGLVAVLRAGNGPALVSAAILQAT